MVFLREAVIHSPFLGRWQFNGELKWYSFNRIMSDLSLVALAKWDCVHTMPILRALIDILDFIIHKACFFILVCYNAHILTKKTLMWFRPHRGLFLFGFLKFLFGL